ncbi:hypothetical protein [Archaeoglobus sp.]
MLERHDLIEAIRRKYRKVGYYVVTEVPLKGEKIKADVVAFDVNRKLIRCFKCAEDIDNEKNILKALEKLKEVANYVYLVIPHHFYTDSLYSKLKNKNFGIYTVDDSLNVCIENHPEEEFRPKRTWVSLLERLTKIYPNKKDALEEHFKKFCSRYGLKL